MFSRKRIELKTPDQVRHMRRAGLVVSDIHAALREAVRAVWAWATFMCFSGTKWLATVVNR